MPSIDRFIFGAQTLRSEARPVRIEVLCKSCTTITSIETIRTPTRKSFDDDEHAILVGDVGVYGLAKRNVAVPASAVENRNKTLNAILGMPSPETLVYGGAPP